MNDEEFSDELAQAFVTKANYMPNKRMMLALLALGALGYSLYLTRIEKSVLGVWCL